MCCDWTVIHIHIHINLQESELVEVYMKPLHVEKGDDEGLETHIHIHLHIHIYTHEFPYMNFRNPSLLKYT